MLHSYTTDRRACNSLLLTAESGLLICVRGFIWFQTTFLHDPERLDTQLRANFLVIAITNNRDITK
jgi:hypothetical protein